MRGDGEEEWGRDANATRWDPLQLLSRRRPALSHLYSAPAQPQPCPGTWAGLGKGDGAALAQTNQARGFRGKHHSRLLLWHHRFCMLGEEGGHSTSQQHWLQPRAISLASPGIQPRHSHGVSNHPTDTGDPSPSSLQTPAGSGIAPLPGECVLVLRMGAGTTFVLRGFRGEQGAVGTLSTVSPTAQPKEG